ncbi:putative membrane protein [Jannaschia seosinensis]|uniref:Protoporphyrinogen IX oxidase n=1 Tax=Jannaschia seosinensis TaxID=313367 RepID=A0A0M7B804_9RHOB|nr:CopD family protein [Jannaschia seosinensis]CUH11376.1 putative membrane protein [Jannaschia seosinensis]
MIDWILGTVPLFKGVHIAALSIWCGGLLALPLMLTRHDPAITQDDYRRIRRATHLTYTVCVTPAAVIAVIAGTWLIFMREAFVPWLYAKLVFVALLVAAHAWVGHILVDVAETPGRSRPPAPYLPVAAILVPVLGILVLVLGKPDLGWVSFPQWLLEPYGGQFPFDVPRR